MQATKCSNCGTTSRTEREGNKCAICLRGSFVKKEKKKGTTTNLDHSDLIDKLVANRLAMKLIVFSEVGIGSRWLLEKGTPLPIPDVMTMKYSYTQSDITIYDAKGTRNDFLGDVGQAKYKKYLTFCDRFYFATQIGLLTKTDIPQDAGLIVYNSGKDTWSVVKSSPRHNAELDRIHWQSLLMAKFSTLTRTRRLEQRMNLRNDIALSNKALNLGHKIREKLRKVEGVKSQVDNIKRTVAEALGIEPEELLKKRYWELKSFIRDHVQSLTIPKEKQLAMEIMPMFANIICKPWMLENREIFIGTLDEFIKMLKEQKKKEEK